MKGKSVSSFTTVAGIIAVVLIAYALWNAWVTMALRNTLRAQTEAGIPNSFGEVAPAPVPAEQNAAPLFSQAFAAMTTATPGEKQSAYLPWVDAMAALAPQPPGAPKAGKTLEELKPEEREALREQLRRPETAAVFDLLAKAAARPACRFDVDYSKGPGILLPHLAHLRKAARLMAVRAWLQADAGNTAEALRDLDAVFRTADMLKDDPILIAQLVRVSCDGTAVACLNQILNMNPKTLPAAETEALRTQLTAQAGSGRAGLVKALDGERVLFGKWIFDQILHGSTVSPDMMGLGMSKTAWWLLRYPGRPLFKADFRHYLLAMAQYRARAQESYAESATEPPVTDSIPRYCILSRIGLPAIERMFQIITGDAASLTLARTGLELAAYREKQGAYPASLSDLDLSVGVPRDPFSGANLLYTTQNAGYVLYSVGPNLKDDGGKTSADSAQTDDIVWRVGAKP